MHHKFVGQRPHRLKECAAVRDARSKPSISVICRLRKKKRRLPLLFCCHNAVRLKFVLLSFFS